MPKISRAKSSARDAATTGDDISRRLCERVAALRKSKGWTLDTLASLSSVSRSMLSEIERGRANPTLGVAQRIAVAFGMTVGELVETPSPTSHIDVIRAADPTHTFRQDNDSKVRTLSPLHLEKDVEFYELVLHPGKTMRSAAHFRGTREFLTVEQGHLRITSGRDAVELRVGDSAHYPADVAHSIENIGRTDAVAFLVDIYRQG